MLTKEWLIENGKPLTPEWLNANGYEAMADALTSDPELLDHIEQESLLELLQQH